MQVPAQPDGPARRAAGWAGLGWAGLAHRAGLDWVDKPLVVESLKKKKIAPTENRRNREIAKKNLLYTTIYISTSKVSQDFRQSKAFAVSGSSRFRLRVIVLPAMEKTDSQGTLVATTANQSRAMLARTGNLS